MFTNTKQALREMWEEGKIFKDPAPMPCKGISELTKALYQDAKEILEVN